MKRLNFAEWLRLKQEMTSAASVSGSGSYSNDIAVFARPLFSGDMVTRQWADLINDDDRKRKKRKKH